MINILVTAVGSELASSVIKAIKLMQTPYRLVGCDIYQEVVGKYWCDSFHLVPQCRDEEAYIKVIRKVIKEEKVDFLIPTADSEFFILPKYKRELSESYGCSLLTNDLDEIELFNDKWLAYKHYKSNVIPSPCCYLIDDLKSLKSKLKDSFFPMIMKPRLGGGSRSIYKIEAFDEIRKYREIVPNPILSEYLLPDDEEYTAGTYRTTQNIVFVIILKRKLKFGMTNSGHIVEDATLKEFCRDTILKTNLNGANNIQFRLTSEGPKVLEINPRFSGTTGIRAHYGFNEIEMWINDRKGCSLEQPALKKGFFMRYMEEQYHFLKN
jgi:carbamoyl-phosphate synthase large subunit